MLKENQIEDLHLYLNMICDIIHLVFNKMEETFQSNTLDWPSLVSFLIVLMHVSIRPSSDGTYLTSSAYRLLGHGLDKEITLYLPYNFFIESVCENAVRATLKMSIMVWWCPSVRVSVRLSVRVSARPFFALFSYMLWHIELKFCTWLCFNVLRIKFEYRHFASIFEGVMLLCELII